MKKVLVFILACLSSSMMLAQELHYTAISQGTAGTRTYMTGMLYIDHVLYYDGVQTPQNLEIGVFDQDGVCRGAKLPTYRANKDQWIYQITIYGDEGFEYTFEIYDHATGQVTDYVEDFGETITWGSGKKYGSLSNPYEINFTEGGPAIVDWGDEWSQVPTIDDDVTIGDDTVIIGDGVVAYANSITFDGTGELIIEQGGQLIHNDNVALTMQLNISGYSKSNPDGYNLISFPTYTNDELFATPISEVDGLIPAAGDAIFDLYYFDESQQGEEWRNFKESANNFNSVEIGKGYLYANNQGAQIAFNGNTLPTTSLGLPLDYTEGKTFAGWNLLGNPFTCNAILDHAFYVLNGNELESHNAGDAVTPLQGFFVYANEPGQECLITAAMPDPSKSVLNLTVSQNLNVVDNGIINFSQSSQLPKFQFNPNSTKVYMPVEGRDYAVVNAEEQGEMPVSFQAQENGSYTLNFSSENAEFSYLHLIDNMTGNDVNLLDNPSYNFDARTTDYTSRFKLVYALGNNSSESNFGFISNGNLMIFGIEGEATLQIIDVTGRILSTENFSGSYSKAINEANGVYMLRLIQGSDVRTQKIVVK